MSNTYTSIPADYLDIDLNGRWNTKIDKLKPGWQEQIRVAKTQKKEVRCYGGSVCANCGHDHGTGGEGGVVHMECPGKPDSRWLWVDPETKFGVCEGCSELNPMYVVACRRCREILPDCRILSP